MTDNYAMELISGAAIEVPGVCWVRQPQLAMFREPYPYGLPYSHGLSYGIYNSMLSLLITERDQLLEAIVSSDGKTTLLDHFTKLPIEEQNNMTSYDVMCKTAPYRMLLGEILNLYCDAEVEVDHAAAQILLTREDGEKRPITQDEYLAIRRVICIINSIPIEEEKIPKFASAAAKKIYEKLQAGRKKRRKQHDPAMELPNIISAVSSKHNSYNLLNIWHLTIWQLYNQFSRLGLSTQIDAYITKWSVWSSENFDWSVWYKPMDQSE